MSNQNHIEEQKASIERLVKYLRDTLKTRTKDFVLFLLDQAAEQTQMPDSLKEQIKWAIDNPEKEFIVNFKENDR